ncbi:MAG: OmpH family outer membrane protein [Halanaerobiales bacterium]
MYKKYLLITAIAIVLIGLTVWINPLGIMASDDAAGKIAIVDVQQVFQVHPDKENAEKDLNEVAQSMQTELEQEAEDVDEEERKNLLEQYQTKLSEEEQKLIKNILGKIDTAIKNVAEEKEVRLVMEKENVIYGGYDMTQDVIDYIEENDE